MRLIDADELKKAIAEFHQKENDRLHNHLWSSIGLNALNRLIDNAPTVIAVDFGVDDGDKTIYARPQGKWNTHQVACILAELFGDTCACNYCGIDEWLPKKCDFANKECPDVVGVACWEQFLKHRSKGDRE